MELCLTLSVSCELPREADLADPNAGVENSLPTSWAPETLGDTCL